jgi:Tfp pilus assembly protein PilF
LEVNERVLGRNHPDTLDSVSNLAFMLGCQANFVEAEPLYRRALESREHVLGAKHPDTLISVNNLGFFLESQGNYAEAEALYRRAYDCAESTLGSAHPHTQIYARGVRRMEALLRGGPAAS